MANVVVLTIDAATKAVTGTCDGRPWTAAPFQWGGKMLMKITDDFRDGFGQGEKVSIGRAAKAAMRGANVEIPVAELKRPRTPKTINGVTVVGATVSSTPAEQSELDVAHAEALAILATAGEDGGEVSDPNVELEQLVPMGTAFPVDDPSAESTLEQNSDEQIEA